MQESEFWAFETYGEPMAVLRRERESWREPGAGQVLVAIRAIGLNRADVLYVRGLHFPPDHLPSGVGVEAAGEILALGEGVAGQGDWTVGQRVCLLPMAIVPKVQGAFRQVGLYDLSQLLPAPPDHSFAEAAAL